MSALRGAIPRFPMIPNLTELDLTPTEVRSPLPAAFGRIEPTAIAFIFARHYLRPSAALTLQR